MDHETAKRLAEEREESFSNNEPRKKQEKVMKIKRRLSMVYTISDIIVMGGYKDTDAQRIIACLYESDKYKNKIKNHMIKGIIVDANMDELLVDLKPLFDEKLREENEEEEQKAIIKAQQEAASKQRKDDKLATNEKLAQTNWSKLQEIPKGSQYYEYKTLLVKDSDVIGAIDAERIELLLNSYALDGWHLKAALTNEVGHNVALAAPIGANATINTTVLILERLVTKE